MKILFGNPIYSYCKRLVSISTPDELVDNVLLKENKHEVLLSLIQSIKRSNSLNPVQNYLGNLLSRAETSNDVKIKIANVLGMFQTEFAARILGNALNGLDINAGEQFQNFITPVKGVGVLENSDITLGDLFSIPIREKNVHVIKAIIEGLSESHQPGAISYLREYAKIDRPHALLAFAKADDLDGKLKGCLFSPFNLFFPKK